MKRVTISMLAALAIVLATVANSGNDHHVKSDLTPNGDSGVSGFAQLEAMPHGGTNIHVEVRGLHPGVVYSSFYYDASDCSGEHDLLGTFTATPAGTGHVQGKIDDDLDEVGSVSVRLGPGYGDLLACARVH